MKKMFSTEMGKRKRAESSLSSNKPFPKSREKQEQGKRKKGGGGGGGRFEFTFSTPQQDGQEKRKREKRKRKSGLSSQSTPGHRKKKRRDEPLKILPLKGHPTLGFIQTSARKAAGKEKRRKGGRGKKGEKAAHQSSWKRPDAEGEGKGDCLPGILMKQSIKSGKPSL